MLHKTRLFPLSWDRTGGGPMKETPPDFFFCCEMDLIADECLVSFSSAAFPLFGTQMYEKLGDQVS